jgi:hypothetical protein
MEDWNPTQHIIMLNMLKGVQFKRWVIPDACAYNKKSITRRKPRKSLETSTSVEQVSRVTSHAIT